MRRGVLILLGVVVLAATAYFWRDFVGYPQISLQRLSREQAAHELSKRLHRDHYADWKTRLNFYGQVVDDQDRPVPGAHVSLQWTNLSFAGTSEATRTSDSDGRFKLTWRRGKSLAVLASKAGYQTSVRNQARFEFADPRLEEFYYEPDARHPAKIHLHKEGKSTTLKKLDCWVNSPSDGSPVQFDLLEGKVSKSGDLQIRCWKPPAVGIYFPYDWRIMLTINNGGFPEQSEGDEFGPLAPAQDYQSTLDVTTRAVDGGRGASLGERLFFVCGQPRKYGRLLLQTNGQGDSVHLEYVLNVAPGERNLD